MGFKIEKEPCAWCHKKCMVIGTATGGLIKLLRPNLIASLCYSMDIYLCRECFTKLHDAIRAAYKERIGEIESCSDTIS